MSASRSTSTLHTESLERGDSGLGPCQLVVVEGPDMGRAIDLGDEPVVVGSAEDCALRLRDARVSRAHLEICADDSGHFSVRDLDSRNGTLYEGSLISEATLTAGATLKLGQTFVRIQPRPQPLAVEPSQSRRFGEMVAESLAMREIFGVLELAAASSATVLLEGETGTGKELAARAVHEASPRQGPFVAIDCGALPEDLLESELFGHVAGAFTGARGARSGAFARADGGTIFLDELGAISLAAQARLLRVLEEREVRPVGADEVRAIDVRVVAAASAGLEARVAEGAFRPDLYYRLSVIRVEIPPLRGRREDIAPLVRELMRRRGLEAGAVEGPNLDRLMAHRWPGNVRELRNVIERAIALTPRAQCFDDLRISIHASAGAEPLAVRTDLSYGEAKERLLREFERRYLGDLIARCDGNISAAAREADVDRKHLRNLLRRHDLV